MSTRRPTSRYTPPREAGQNLELEYLSASRDELTTRVVEPMQVITVDGHWYLDAYCHRAGDMRRFRVDRIVKARQLDQSVSDEVRRPRPAEDMFVPGPGAYEVHLQLAPGASWVAESIPVRQVNRDGAGLVTGLVMDVAGLAWFERLLLQLGPAAGVVSPPELTAWWARPPPGSRYARVRPSPARSRAGLRRARRAPAVRHGRNERFQRADHRGVSGQPRKSGRELRRGAHGPHHDDRRQVRPEAYQSAGLAALGGCPVHLRLQGRRAHQSRLVLQPPGHPEVEVEFGDEKFTAVASRVEGPERDRIYAKQVEVFPGFGDYERPPTG